MHLMLWLTVSAATLLLHPNAFVACRMTHLVFPGWHSRYNNLTTNCTVWGSNLGGGKKFFASPKCPDGLLVPFILLFSGYQGSFQGVRQEEYHINHSRLSRTEVKSEWNCTSALPLHLYDMDWDKFTFTQHK
jgi:hypothetical protein